jgi:hypothetical protein
LNFVTAALTPIESIPSNIAPDDGHHKIIPNGGAKPKKHVAHMPAQIPEGPQELERSPDYGAYVGARVGANAAPLTAAPPAFLQ